MKRILFALAMFALVLPAVPRANGAEVTVDFLYNNLEGGSWIEADDYGYGWQPDVAVSSSDWRPYADGYWAYTDYGWTWVSYEDFGWATYHYGRWIRLADYGWVWFPDAELEWGPAWVSWRFGGNQCGWAPLPPRRIGVAYVERQFGPQVDVEFDIGPAYYNFVDIRFIGEPVLRSHIYAPSYNVTYITQTVNVTNITVKNKVVYNYGPDVEVLSRHSARPIQRLKIDRQTNVDFSAAAKTGGLTKVQGDRLIVAAPSRIEKPARQIAPPRLKTKIAKNQLKVDNGWSVVGDEKKVTELKQQIKTQDPKKIPPPTEGASAAPVMGGSTPAPEGAAGSPGSTPSSANAGASPMTSATLAPAPFEQGKGRGKRGQAEESKAQSPVGAMGESASPGAMASPMDQMERGRGKNKGKRGMEPGMSASPANAMSPVMEATPFQPGKGKGKLNRDFQGPPTPSTDGTPGGPKGMRDMNRGQGMSGAAGAGEGQGQGLGKHKGRRLDQPPGGAGELQGAPTASGQEPQGIPGGGGGKHKGRGQQTIEPSGAPGGAPAVGEQGQGKQGKGKRQKEEVPPASPAPTP